jgi:hypothetical protein
MSAAKQVEVTTIESVSEPNSYGYAEIGLGTGLLASTKKASLIAYARQLVGAGPVKVSLSSKPGKLKQDGVSRWPEQHYLEELDPVEPGEEPAPAAAAAAPAVAVATHPTPNPGATAATSRDASIERQVAAKAAVELVSQVADGYDTLSDALDAFDASFDRVIAAIAGRPS